MKSAWGNAPAMRIKNSAKKLNEGDEINGLQVHYEIYSDRLHRYHLQLKDARDPVISKIIINTI